MQSCKSAAFGATEVRILPCAPDCFSASCNAKAQAVLCALAIYAVLAADLGDDGRCSVACWKRPCRYSVLTLIVLAVLRQEDCPAIWVTRFETNRKKQFELM